MSDEIGKRKLHVGDSVILFCEKANGLIFSPPPLDPKLSTVSIHSIDTLPTHTGFTDAARHRDYTCSFVIQPYSCTWESGKHHIPSKEMSKKELVYGRKVLLYHAVSKIYLTFSNSDSTSVTKNKEGINSSVFRFLPSDPCKFNGQQIYEGDSVRLEIWGEQDHKLQALCVPNLLNLKYMGYDLKTASNGSDFVLHSHFTWEKQLALKSSAIIEACDNVSPLNSLTAYHSDLKLWIEENDEKMLKTFYALSGVFIVLKELLEKLYNSQGQEKVVVIPTDVLDALANWTKKSSDTSSMQKWPDMLIYIGGVELVLEFLEMSTDSRIQKSLCIVLENYIKYASEKSQVYLTSKQQLLNTLFPLMGQKVEAENVLSALIKCRSLSFEILEEHLERYFEKPEELLKPDFQILKCLCMSGGRPNEKIQNQLLDQVIIPCHEKSAFFKLKCDDANGVVILPPSASRHQDIQLLILQLEFYTSVCQGVNLYCIDKMTKVQSNNELLTYDTAIACLDHYKDLPCVQSAFFSYLMATLIDKNAQESGVDLDNFWYIYSWNTFNESFQSVELSGIANTHSIISDKKRMIIMQNEIQHSLETKNWQTDRKEGWEELVIRKLCALEMLVAFGFYWMADDNKGGAEDAFELSPEKVIKALIDILVVLRDDEQSGTNTAALQSKAIDVLNLFLHQTYHLGTARLIFDFRTNKEQASDSNAGHQSAIQIENNPEVQRAEACNKLKWLLFEQKPDPPLTGIPDQGLCDYEFLNIYNTKSSTIVSQLVEFLASEDDDLCLAAAKLLFDLFNGESYLFNKSERSLIVIQNLFPTYTTMVKYANYQDQPVRALLKLMQGKGAAKPEINRTIMEFLNEVIFVAGNPPKVTGFHPRDETFTSAMEQSVVLTTGVYSILLNYVLKYSVTDDSSQEKLINKVCEALQAIARGNNQVKEVVCPRFDDLLNAKQGISVIAHLLTEVLTDNICACRKISLASVEKMFTMVAHDNHFEFAPTIEAWIKVGKSSPQLMKVHQRFVCELCEKFFKDKYKAGWDPETSPQEMDDKFILFTHMLGVCVEGIHKYCEDVVRGRFKFSALAKIMVDKKLTLQKRLPFVILMNEGYLKTETESQKSVMDFAQDRSLWYHVEAMTQVVKLIKEKLESIENKKIVACQKIKLRILFSQHMTHMYWHQHKILSINMNKSFEEEVIKDGTKDGTPLSILYQYLIEGILPCLSTFAKKYKILWESYKDRLTDESKQSFVKRKHILETFGLEMQSLVKTFHAIFVSTQAQLVYWTTTLEPLVCINNDQVEVYSLKIKPADYETREELAEEEELNKQFHTYLKNFKELILCNSDQASLYPTGPGYKLLLEHLFPALRTSTTEENLENLENLVKLLKILYKRIKQSHNTKDTLALNKMVLNIMQVLSGVLYREVNTEGRDDIGGWQKIFMEKKVHKNCVLYMNHPDNEIVLQILGLFRLATLNANLKAQELVYNKIRNSVFCDRVYMLLGHVISTFTEAWAKNLDNEPPKRKNEALQSLDSSIRTGSIVLDCVSALCDGQNRNMQCFLLNKKRNIVKQIAILLDVLTDEYNTSTKVLQLQLETEESNTPKRVYSYLNLIQKAIQALIETTVSNYSNQQAVFECQITDTICCLLTRTMDTAEHKDEMKKKLSGKAIELLQVLLEETHDKSVTLIANFCEDVNLDVIVKAMLTWKDIGAYHILRIVADSRDISMDKLASNWKINKELLDDFKARSRSIEVLYRPFKGTQKILTKQYFDFDPIDEIPELDKETITNAIAEESQKEKLAEFNKWGRPIRHNAEYKQYLNKGRLIWVFRAIYETSGPRHWLLVALTVLLNILVLSVTVAPSPSSSGNYSNNFIYDPTLPEWYFLPILGILHIILSVWMVLEFFVTKKPNFTKDTLFVTAFQMYWKSFKRWVSQQEMLQHICPKDWRLQQKRRYLTMSQDCLEEEDSYYYEDEKEDGYFEVPIFGVQSMYRFVFLMCSIAAIPLQGYPYCICLFYVFVNVDVVQYIFTALYGSCKLLVFIGLITAGIFLVFSVVAFLFIQDHFNETDDNPLFCNSLWQCFISVSREGLLDTLGQAIPFKENASYTYYAVRTIFFDLPFFLIVTTFILSIVIAALTDKFSGLREERDKIKSKMMKACFICGIDSGSFEGDGKGFKHHVKEDHNKWNYIYYLMYLDRKPRNDLTALEKQIADDNEIEKCYGKTDHYPIGKAKVIAELKE